MVKYLLIIGHDKICRKAINELFNRNVNLSKYDIAVDKSTNFLRIYKLIRNGSVSFRCLFNMASAELKRRDYPNFDADFIIKSNGDLHYIFKHNTYRNVYLFRVGLIMDPQSLSFGPKFLNIHCASIPEYGGLCAIYKATKDKSYNQEACLHVVTKKIDDPTGVEDIEKYLLDPNKDYFQNEEVAYDAGIRLLNRVIIKND